MNSVIDLRKSPDTHHQRPLWTRLTWGGSIRAFLTYGILITVSLLALYPFVWVVLSSLKDNFEIYGNAFGLPRVWKFENYVRAWTIGNFETNFFNSIFIASGATIGVIVIAAMASYILARVKPNNLLYVYFTVGIMIPFHALLIPTFIFIRDAGLINKRIGLMLVYIATNMAMSIFILTGFLKSLPRSLEEAALIEGCSWPRIFFQIIFPLSKPGLATIGTLAFLNCWNEFLYASILIADPLKKTLSLGIAAMKGQYFTDYGIMCAGLAITIVPIAIFYIIFQEQVIRGMAAGAVKG